MDEIKEAGKDTAQETDQSSTSGDETTSTTPQTYTREQGQADIKKAVSDALAEQGRKHKAELEPIKQERDTFKSKSAQADADSETTKTRVADLESDLESAHSEDPDLRDIHKVRVTSRTERDRVIQEYRVKGDALTKLVEKAESERLEFAGEVAEAQAFKFDGELARLVDEYDGDVTTNFNKLKVACDKAGIKTKEGAEAIAELYMAKKTEEPNLLDDSGVTTGVGTGIPTRIAEFRVWIENMSQEEYEKRRPEIEKAQAEGKIK